MYKFNSLLFFLSSYSTTKNKIISYSFSNSFSSLKNIIPKTKNQELFDEYLNNNKYKIVICSGPAGSGKTILSCNHAVNFLDEYSNIILTKPLVSVDNEDLGFLPGNLEKKMTVWAENYIQILSSLTSTSKIQQLIKKGSVQIKPMSYMRGKTFDDSLIIADEMQNSSPIQMKMLMTRLGLNSKMIILGDNEQKDNIKISGLEDFLNKYNSYYQDFKQDNNDLIKIINMNDDDVLRSPLVKQIINIYKYKKTIPSFKSQDISIFTKKDLETFQKNSPL
jgi:phosphate starvation-inducible PhoH-like protein